ncbi:hypothetical protein [Microbacterium sp. GXF6406]
MSSVHPFFKLVYALLDAYGYAFNRAFDFTFEPQSDKAEPFSSVSFMYREDVREPARRVKIDLSPEDDKVIPPSARGQRS